MSTTATPQPNASFNKEYFPKINRSGRGSWLAVLLVCGLVGVPLLKDWWGGELERWEVAAVNLLYQSGQKELAIAKLKTIAERPRASDFTKLELANFLLDAGRADEAMGWTEELRGKLPKDSRELSISDSDPQSQILHTHFRALVANGRMKDAGALLQFWSDAVDRHDNNPVLWTNNFAYHCALAKHDLQGADQRMRALLESRSASRSFGRILWILPYEIKLLAATALIAVELKEPDGIEALLGRLDEQIDNLDDQYKQASQRMRAIAWLEMQDGRLTEEDGNSPLAEARFQAELKRRSLAVLVAVRALLHQRDGDTQKVVEAAEKLSELDVNLQELIDVMPTFYSCLDLVEEGATFWDTHGWVLFQLEQLSEAFDLIDLAVISNQIAAKGYEQGEFLMGRSQRAIRDYFETRRRQSATLLGHRYQIHVVTGDAVAAEQDARAIEALGFRVGDPRLF